MVPKGWEVKTLGAVLEKIAVPVEVDPNATYQEIGIRSHGKGIFHKEPVLGSSIGDKRVFWVQPNAFVVNIVFAWEQAIARTTGNEQGMIASHRFPMFLPQKGRCDIDYLVYFFNTKKGKALLELASPGGAGRNKTLGQKDFLDIAIPFPPVEEQVEIAQIVSIWDRAVIATEKLIANYKCQKISLMQDLLFGKRNLNGVKSSWRLVTLGELVTINPPRPIKPFNGKVSFVPMDAVSVGAKLKYSLEKSYCDVSTGFSSFMDGDILVAKITPCFENGKGAVIKDLINGVGFGSTEFHVIRARKGVSADFIYHVTNSYEFRVRGEACMQGSAGQKRLPSDFLRSFKFNCPVEHEEQLNVATILNELDLIIENLINQLNVLIKERKSLIHQLLSGKLRVNSNSSSNSNAQN